VLLLQRVETGYIAHIHALPRAQSPKGAPRSDGDRRNR